ncbi:hypothetical protein Nepgr_003492 [Nepenthes gracilis]|uniref:Uncharacterized protein n=1 Tax=Nepenthes gracilis TaxID=150966 RepID=A0AAD3RZQ0_NEPGR|nr:hypothetical protein Nepgr_003492 [Nepenthes gracilis]
MSKSEGWSEESFESRRGEIGSGAVQLSERLSSGVLLSSVEENPSRIGSGTLDSKMGELGDVLGELDGPMSTEVLDAFEKSFVTSSNERGGDEGSLRVHPHARIC